MKNLFISLLFLSIIGCTSVLYGQRWGEKNWGFQVGLSVGLGTHIRQVGVKIQGYYNYKFVQLNAGDHILFCVQNIGGRKNYIAQRINTGIVLLAGKKDMQPQFILDGLHHQTSYEYGLAYNYLWYIDNIGSTQKSGGFGVHIKQVSIVVENDLFAGFGRDRYRTGFASISYHNGPFRWSINNKIWTGKTRGAPIKNTLDSSFQVGYRDLRDMPFGRFSNGILNIRVDYQIFYGNTVSGAIGIDDEHIRNVLQNKFIHDERFIPRSIRNPTPNYPMLDKKGLPTLNEEEVKPARFFFQVGLNKGITF